MSTPLDQWVEQMARHTRPARVIGITYFPQAPIKGMEILQSFYASKPKSAFDTLSMSVRIKARIKFTRKPNDDDYDVLEFLPRN